MTRTGLITVLLSICLSSVVSGGLVYWHDRQKDTVGRFSRIELIDSEHRVRATLGMIRSGGRDVPQLTLGADELRPAIALRTNEKNEGTMYFSSRDREGKVRLGYFPDSDVTDAQGRYIGDAGTWGLTVFSATGYGTSIGVFNNGNVVEPARASTK